MTASSFTDAVLLSAVEQVLNRRAAPTAAPWSEAQMLDLARAAVGKVDRLGVRGITLLSIEEIAAMAAVLIASGALLPPSQKGQD